MNSKNYAKRRTWMTQDFKDAFIYFLDNSFSCMTTCPQLSEDMAPGFEFNSPPQLVRKSYSFWRHKTLVTVLFCVFLANRSNQTIEWLIIIWTTLSSLKRTWWCLYSDLSASTKPQLQSQNFSWENLICWTMMLVICRPLQQESSINRLRKGQYRCPWQMSTVYEYWWFIVLCEQS